MKCRFPGCITELAPKQYTPQREDDYPQFCFLHSRVLTQNEIKFDSNTGRFYTRSGHNKNKINILPEDMVAGLKETVEKNDFLFTRKVII